jgi:hypothetical protein
MQELRKNNNYLLEQNALLEKYNKTLEESRKFTAQRFAESMEDLERLKNPIKPLSLHMTIWFRPTSEMAATIKNILGVFEFMPYNLAAAQKDSLAAAFRTTNEDRKSEIKVTFFPGNRGIDSASWLNTWFEYTFRLDSMIVKADNRFELGYDPDENLATIEIRNVSPANLQIEVNSLAELCELSAEIDLHKLNYKVNNRLSVMRVSLQDPASPGRHRGVFFYPKNDQLIPNVHYCIVTGYSFFSPINFVSINTVKKRVTLSSCYIIFNT